MQTLERKTAAKDAEVYAFSHRRTHVAWWLFLVAALGFAAAGPYTIARGLDARNEVRDQLAAEKIVTPDDASIPNAPVVDHVTAHAQADVIQKHMLEATGGKTYAELDREDPARQTAFTAATLRTSLMAAALAWHVAELAIGIGTFITAIGILLLIGLVLLRPTRTQRA